MRLFDWLRASTALTNASGVHADKVGEFGLMATLMLHERVPARRDETHMPGLVERPRD